MHAAQSELAKALGISYFARLERESDLLGSDILRLTYEFKRG